VKKAVLLLVTLFLIFQAKAQQDTTAPSPFSISAGAGGGAGFTVGKIEPLMSSYELLHNEFRAYVDVRYNVTVLFKEKFGFRVSSGRLGRRGAGDGFVAYLNSSYPGYKFLYEYSSLESGYTYQYVMPQFVYRRGSEPFNLTLCAGLGYGITSHAGATIVLQDEGTNDFKQVNYSAVDSRNLSAGLDAEFAYMRQLSQHWFMNAGVSVAYTGLFQYYDFIYEERKYQQSFWVGYSNHEDGLMHHIAAGVFVNFQWNTKESERAIYE
jgi:hypothetical protein